MFADIGKIWGGKRLIILPMVWARLVGVAERGTAAFEWVEVES